MLKLYDAVVYTDCDEILVPDPANYSGLLDFCQKMRTPCATAIGLNLMHNIQSEKLIDANISILQQRKYGQFVSPMFKSLIIRQPVIWSAGFHSSNLVPAIFDIYLFHIRWVDIVQCLKRLDITKDVVFSHDRPTHHHSTIAQFIDNFLTAANRTKQEDFNARPFIEKVAALFKKTENGQFVIDGDIRSPEMFRIPDRFRDTF